MEGKLRIMTEATAGSNKIWPAGGRRNQIGDRCHLMGHYTTLPPDTFYNKDGERREGSAEAGTGNVTQNDGRHPNFHEISCEMLCVLLESWGLPKAREKKKKQTLKCFPPNVQL